MIKVKYLTDASILLNSKRAFVELNCDTHELNVDGTDVESPLDLPEEIVSGRILRWYIDTKTKLSIANKLLDLITSDAETILNGYSLNLSGSEIMAHYDQDAFMAIISVDQKCQDISPEICDGILMVTFKAVAAGLLFCSSALIASCGPTPGDQDVFFYRSGHTLTSLDTDTKLMIGGLDSTSPVLHTAVLDVSKNRWLKGNDLNVGRWYHTATTLCDGRILIVGGYVDSYVDEATGDTVGIPTASAEIYNPDTMNFMRIVDMSVARGKHIAKLLDSCDVEITGGDDGIDEVSNIIVFNPDSDSFEEL